MNPAKGIRTALEPNKPIRRATMENPFTRTYELGKEFGSKMQRLETVATLRKLIESADDHTKPTLEALLKVIEVKDE